MATIATDAEQFARLRAAFHRLLELDLGERGAALAAIALEQPELAAHLNTLFERLDEADLLPAGEPAPPDRLGVFRVGRRIGRGGMGEVYLGERADGGFVQQVALKLVRGAALAPDLARRFVRERQILARLQHPHIARLIDGGMTGDGRPWLAMEYVDGERITAWCAARRLDIAARLRLLLPVIDAVQAAHRNLVVHRDIKPGNVLVDAEGRPTLLDFGIARLLDDDGAEGTATLAVMTPAYAAPEQRSGGEISTATDVYQLGVLLRELLVGAAQPVPASLRRIGERATAERPGERYASAAAFGDDLSDWLARRPLRSGIDAGGERLRLALRQWRWPLLMGVVVLLALGGGALLAWREARIAHANALEARANLQALLGVISAANPGRYAGREPVVGDLLIDVAAQLQADFAGDPHLLQQALGEIGHGLLNLGRAREAEPVLQAALRALADDPEANPLTEIGLLKLLVLAHSGAASLPSTRRSIDRLLVLADEPAHRGPALDGLASAAAALARSGDMAAALQLFADAEQRDRDGDAMNVAQAENFWRQRGLVALRAALPAEAQAAFQRSRRMQLEAPAEFGSLRRAELDLFMAEAAIAADDAAGAASALRRAIPVWQAEYPEDHPERGYLALLQARSFLLRGDPRSALPLAEAAQRRLPSATSAASTASVVAVALAQSGRCDEALPLQEAVADAFEASPRGNVDRERMRRAIAEACGAAE